MFKKLKIIISFVIISILLFYTYQTYNHVKTVVSYRGMVREILAENDTVANEDLVLAMIYTETKGKEVDLMQSSESSTGIVNSITDSKESIRQGVSVLSDNILEAQKQDVDVWTAIQAYNFGKNYITYIAQNGNRHTVDLAKTYSRTVVAPSLGNTSEQTYHYYNPIALYYGGGELYVNGGNIYYAKQVEFNLFLIKVFNKIIF